MSAVEQMKTRHITSFKASSQGAKRSFFVYSNMVSEIPIKENQSQSHVKRKWPDGWSGGGGGGDYYIFPSKEGDLSRNDYYWGEYDTLQL